MNAVMRAIWSKDQDVSDPKVLVAMAGRHGIDATELIEAVRGKRCVPNTGTTPVVVLPPGFSDHQSTRS
jgi:2-hydroxychromene-2-carboxylate isomerase